MRRVVIAVVVLAVVAAAAGWFATAPRRLDGDMVAAVSDGDAARGERIFYAGGCTSCHAKPGATGDAVLRLSGGLELKTGFGTFVAPNISQHPQDGIGSWSAEDFGNAVLRGVSPAGEHYYPAFPYGSYVRMQPADVGDLYAFMKTLPQVEGKAPATQLGFPFNIRRGVGLWKLANIDVDPVTQPVAGEAPTVALGRYLVEGPGHCGECHTPRNLAQGLDKGRWLAGAKAAEGTGTVPNITTGEGGIGDWSEGDIVSMLETGFTPEFDTIGGSMAPVQRNMAKLTAEDRAGIAAYLKAVPPHANGYAATTAAK